ncbi:hypothetical protein ES319_A11G254600v1 [Gossypium barbadense]|uniref:Uncharacterized protein n=3 Tax=Gossypium TaxID=3633 RepID=A0A5J5TXQ5_GOSBA|nr:hypothetical protein ES319_A11G254600v1 [Gossypium barbadense]KAB2058740.1 hypothetical protein ES319_A11G254600v1 [Gossypium barbadense]TYG95563.1 hypothetical protein ES288_A11G277700v1 [Gossypium darwinii]
MFPFFYLLTPQPLVQKEKRKTEEPSPLLSFNLIEKSSKRRGRFLFLSPLFGCIMTGFWFHHFWLPRFPIMGRGLRVMRATLSRTRRVNGRVMRSLRDSQVAASEMVRQNRRTRAKLELIFVANTLANQWVYDRLVEIENDPLMRNAFERTRNLGGTERNSLNMNRARAFRGRRRRP